MMVREVLPVRLRELREHAQLTQAQLAEAVEAATVQISRYETGSILPSIDTLTRLAEALDCSTDYLLGRSLTPRVSAVTLGDLMPDEERLIQALRDNDIRATLVMLSLLVDSRSGDDPGRVAEAIRIRREKRQLQNRKQYVAEIARKVLDVPVVIAIEPRNQPTPPPGSPSGRSRSDTDPKQR